MLNGIININKAAGFTSFDVVAKLRRITHQKKIGHTGTLDPDATGVLPVCFGNATKVCSLLTDRDKTYEAIMLLGISTDTQDISGSVISQKEVSSDDSSVRDTIMSFAGEYDQIPPMYSAKKVDGKRLYTLAREGREVERRPCRVKIFDMQIHDIRLPEVSFSVTCSKGTYIRTLCSDIGDKLGCGACMKSLKRTRVGNFDIRESLTLDEIEQLAKEEPDMEALRRRLVGVDELFAGYKAGQVLSGNGERALLNGNPLAPPDFSKAPDGEHIRVYDASGAFRALYLWDKRKRLYFPEKMFL